jgi:tetratricopeptide (TPR) repeat protein
VIVSGLIAGIYWWPRRARALPPEPPPIPLEGVEKSVADAVAASREQVRRKPDSAEAWGYLGELLMTHRFPTQAEECFVEAEKLDGKQPRWPYYRGLLHLHQDDQLVLTHLKRAVELTDQYDPGAVSVRLRYAEVLLEQGQTEEAEAQFRIAFERAPQNPWLLYHRGLLALARNDLDGAIERLTPLTNHPSARQKACAQLAMIYRRKQDEAKAADFARRAAQLPPDEPWDDPYVTEFRQLQRDAQGRLVQVKSLEAARKVGEAILLLKTINEETDNDLARLALGATLAKLEKYDEAEKALRNTLALYPDKVQAHYFLAEVLLIQGDRTPDKEAALAKYRDAAEHARRAIALKPDHGLAHLCLGRALRILGQPDEALKELRAAVACKPEEAETHQYLGEALVAAGQAEEGKHHLELATRLAKK